MHSCRDKREGFLRYPRQLLKISKSNPQGLEAFKEAKAMTDYIAISIDFVNHNRDMIEAIRHQSDGKHQ